MAAAGTHLLPPAHGACKSGKVVARAGPLLASARASHLTWLATCLLLLLLCCRVSVQASQPALGLCHVPHSLLFFLFFPFPSTSSAAGFRQLPPPIPPWTVDIALCSPFPFAGSGRSRDLLVSNLMDERLHILQHTYDYMSYYDNVFVDGE